MSRDVLKLEQLTFEDLDDWLALRWIKPEPEIAEKTNDAALAELIRHTRHYGD